MVRHVVVYKEISVFYKLFLLDHVHPSLTCYCILLQCIFTPLTPLLQFAYHVLDVVLEAELVHHPGAVV